MLTRRHFVKSSVACGFALLASGTAFGCSPASSSSSSATNQVIVAMSTSSEPEAGFDPFYSWGCGEHVHEPLIQSTLITTDANLDFVNDLATSYSCSDDGLSWTFDIRGDVTFTDGQPLTAHDVAFTINGIKNFEGSELDLSYVEQATATSDTQVVIRLNKPFNALLYTLAVVGIVPEHAYDSKTYGANPIGSGRYKLAQWDKGQQAIFTANPDYYGDAPLMERVVVLFTEEDAALAAAQSGSVDIAYTAATLADKTPSNYELFTCESVDSRGISLPTTPSGSTKEDGGKTYPCGNDITCNLEVRQAINYALNRETLIKNTLNGHGVAAYSVCDALPWGTADMKVSHDASKADKLLTDAGWAKNSSGYYAKDGTEAAFTLYYPASDSVRQALANEFMNQMKAFGINVSITGSSWTTDENGLYAHQFSDPILWGWGANSPTQLYDLIYGASSSNYANYANETIDSHVDKALAASSVADSYDEWQQAQWDGEQGVAPQGGASWVWLANIDHLYFKRENLQVAEQKPHPHGHGWSLLNNVDKWTWK